MTHVATLSAYSFPIVVRALEKYGLPGQITALPKEEQGPLAVTLAAELASITTRLLVDSYRRLKPEQRKDFRIPKALEENDPRDVLEAAFLLRERCFGELQSMECYIQALFPPEATVFMAEVGSKANQDSFSKEVSRLPKSWPDRKELQSLLPPYRAKSKFYLSSINLHRACRKVRPFREMLPVGTVPKIKSRKSALKSDGPEEESGDPVETLAISFDGPATISDDGCSRLLRHHNRDWWAKITGYIEKQVGENLNRNPVKFLLRHPDVAGEVKRAEENWSAKGRFDRRGTVLSVLKKVAAKSFFVSSKWFGDNHVFNNFKTLLHSLKQEDEMAKRWIIDNDSSNPYNPYVLKKSRESIFRKPALKERLFCVLARPRLNR